MSQVVGLVGRLLVERRMGVPPSPSQGLGRGGRAGRAASARAGGALARLARCAVRSNSVLWPLDSIRSAHATCTSSHNLSRPVGTPTYFLSMSLQQAFYSTVGLRWSVDGTS